MSSQRFIYRPPVPWAYEGLPSCWWNSGLSNDPVGFEVPGTDVPGLMADSNQGVLTQAPREGQPQGQMASTQYFLTAQKPMTQETGLRGDNLLIPSAKMKLAFHSQLY